MLLVDTTVVRYYTPGVYNWHMYYECIYHSTSVYTTTIDYWWIYHQDTTYTTGVYTASIHHQCVYPRDILWVFTPVVYTPLVPTGSICSRPMIYW